MKEYKKALYEEFKAQRSKGKSVEDSYILATLLVWPEDYMVWDLDTQ